MMADNRGALQKLADWITGTIYCPNCTKGAVETIWWLDNIGGVQPTMGWKCNFCKRRFPEKGTLRVFWTGENAKSLDEWVRQGRTLVNFSVKERARWKDEMLTRNYD